MYMLFLAKLGGKNQYHIAVWFPLKYTKDCFGQATSVSTWRFQYLPQQS